MVANGLPGAEKEELEKQKLQAEIEEIKLKIEQGKKRLDFERKDTSKEHFRSWATIIISIVTIAVGGATIGEKVNTFFSQSTQTERVKINKDMIGLVKELKSNDKDERQNAALLLSAYEKEAVPVLLKNLESSDQSESISIIESLKLIKVKLGAKNKDVLTALMEKAEAVFRDEKKNLPTINQTITPEQEKAEKCISNFIFGLKKLYGDKPEIKKLFQSWKNEIESRRPPVREDNKKTLIDRLEGE